MKNIYFSLTAFVLLFSCANASKQECSENSITTTQLKNYAVVWQWAVNDADMITTHLECINDDMLEMWRNGEIENAYYNADSEISSVENLPNICYFLKAESYKSARERLNELAVVKNGIATFSVFPVGSKWFGRNADAIQDKGLTKSYVSVWKTLTDINVDEYRDLIDAQATSIKNLYQSGDIENVYWEMSGEEDAYKRRTNNISDFVFFINTNNKKDAKALCDSIGFIQAELMSYEVIPVGVFWLGEYQEN